MLDVLHVICTRLRSGHLSVRLRQFAALCGDCKKSRIAPLNTIIIIIIIIIKSGVGGGECGDRQEEEWVGEGESGDRSGVGG